MNQNRTKRWSSACRLKRFPPACGRDWKGCRGCHAALLQGSFHTYFTHRRFVGRKFFRAVRLFALCIKGIRDSLHIFNQEVARYVSKEKLCLFYDSCKFFVIHMHVLCFASRSMARVELKEAKRALGAVFRHSWRLASGIPPVPRAVHADHILWLWYFTCCSCADSWFHRGGSAGCSA